MISKESESKLKVFSQKLNLPLLMQYVRVYRANQRVGNAKTKTRGEVSGGGKKPWKQKGTGHARVGSIRNPVWRHGGVAHGPVLRDWSLKIPKKMKAKALSLLLSDKISNAKLFSTDKIELSEGRTKELLELIKNWGLKGKLLIVTRDKNDRLAKASLNLPHVEISTLSDLNPFKILSCENVIFEREALDSLKERYDEIE